MDNDNLAAAFGRYEDWNWPRPMIPHVMEELARLHWEDEGQDYPGFAAASGGLRLAVAADTIEPVTEKAAHVLHHLGWIAAYMTTLDVDEVQLAALSEIITATEAWRD